MKRLLFVCLLASACSQAELNPASPTKIAGPVDTVDVATKLGPIPPGTAPKLDPIPPGIISMPEPDPMLASCSLWDYLVDAYVRDGGRLNNIAIFPGSGLKFYIVDTGVSPGYRWEPYPDKWCSK